MTGLGYEFNTNVDFERILESIVADPSIVARLKDGCIKKAEDFLPENAIKPLFERIK